MKTKTANSNRCSRDELLAKGSGQRYLTKEVEGILQKTAMAQSGLAPVIPIQPQFFDEKAISITIGAGGLRGRVSREDQQRADRLRKSALADLEEKKYRLAYKKMCLAAEKDPLSGQLAEDRRRAAACYRERLDAYLYFLLVPWLPFILYVRFLSSESSAAEDEGSGMDGTLFLALVFCILVIGTAVWIQRKKEKVQ